MTRSSFIALWAGTACILLAFALTGNQNLLGGLIGYWTGCGWTIWVHRDTLASSELDVRSAVHKMRLSFFSRLGVVTMIVAAVARLRENWLLGLALGIALGLMVSFITVAIQRIHRERGEEENG